MAGTTQKHPQITGLAEVIEAIGPRGILIGTVGDCTTVHRARAVIEPMGEILCDWTGVLITDVVTLSEIDPRDRAVLASLVDAKVRAAHLCVQCFRPSTRAEVARIEREAREAADPAPAAGSATVLGTVTDGGQVHMAWAREVGGKVLCRFGSRALRITETVAPLPESGQEGTLAALHKHRIPLRRLCANCFRPRIRSVYAAQLRARLATAN
ncbi:hypothetical protein [Saccharothrix hoggarensis]|uniref:Uncharacterized protein n=1 Tax=Saccharothrix hoggarensis TaxID=913853 RepID=A0ABW3QMD6_9PSEU